MLQNTDDAGAPFYFYYNPHRYPDFLSGVSKTFDDSYSRRDMFFASGGTERTPNALDKRLQDALVFCGGEYLDGFVLEYVCPFELGKSDHLGPELQQAINHVRSYVDEDKVRYVIASTHSHRVGRALAGATMLDAIMLRYNMSHKRAAETISFPQALKKNIPVIAFTTTRWNRLQRKASPTINTADCLKFALKHPAVEVVLHSARDEDELNNALSPLFSCSNHLTGCQSLGTMIFALTSVVMRYIGTMMDLMSIQMSP
jgi:aryl-alcohol dehydrogenase-like predicted oxidoreductase